MTWSILYLLVSLAAGGAPSTPPHARDVVVRVGHDAITAAEVLAEAGPDPNAQALAAALRQLIAERALAGEARSVLGATVATLKPRARARALLESLFDPGRRCQRIPEPMKRQYYGEQSWRFAAPPGWTVDDAQLLCCKKPRECGTAEAEACIDGLAERARTLRATLPDQADQTAWEAALEAAAVQGLHTKRYTYFHDPEAPGAKMHWRLQDVDAPIAKAVSDLTPGRVAGPIRTRFGWHVLRLVETRPAADFAYDAPHTQAVLATELCMPFLQAQRERYLADLLATVPLQLELEALKTSLGLDPEALKAP